MVIRYFRSFEFLNVPRLKDIPGVRFSSQLQAVQEIKPLIYPPRKHEIQGCSACNHTDGTGLMFLGSDGELYCCACSKEPHELVRVEKYRLQMRFSEANLN